MLQRDDGQVEDDDSYASCVEETNSDLYEQTTDTNTVSSKTENFTYETECSVFVYFYRTHQVISVETERS